MLPYGAQEIQDLRMIGKIPANMVMVSLIGRLPKEKNNPVVVAAPGCDDWKFLHKLDAMLVVSKETDKDRIRQVVRGILAAEPRYLGVVWYELGDGVTVAWGKYQPKSALLRRWTRHERVEWKLSTTA